MNRIARLIHITWPPLTMFFLIAAVAEVVIRFRQVPQYLLPAPSSVFATFAGEHRELLAALGSTSIAAIAGFLAAVVLGVLLAIVLSASRLVQRALYPYMIFFQTVPVVAIAPLLVIWAGVGTKSVAICAGVVAIFPVIANTLSGILSTDPALVDMFRLYGAGWWTTLWKLKLPWALPNVVTGMRIAAGLSVIGAIVGEFVAGSLQGDAGLGVSVMVATRIGRTDRVFAAILTASLLGWAMFGMINLLGHILLRKWHASQQQSS